MRTRWSAQAWFAMVLVVMVIVLAGSSLVGSMVLRHTTGVSNRLSDVISPARIQAERLRTALVDQETGARGFLLTGKEDFLGPYLTGQAAEREAAVRIRALAPGAPPLRRLDEVERLSAQWRAQHVEPLIQRIRRDGAENVPTGQADAGRRAFETLRDALDAQEAAWGRARDQSRADLEAARSLRDISFIGIIAIFLLTIIALAILLRLVVFRPLERLREASRRVTAGDFGQHVDTGGPADVAELARDIEAMRLRIVTELEETRQSRELLAQQAEELRRSNGELEQFAYVASHDLQEPLRKVASFTQMLEQRYGDQLDDRARQYIGFAVDGAKRMQALINELLAFSRIGRVNADPVRLKLKETVDLAMRNLSARVEETGGTVEVGDLPEITGDRTQLVMLWQNLIGNALKFRDPSRAPVVRIDAERDGAEWRVTVTDNGIGIEPRFAEKIFLIFQRLHNRDAYEGTGIGLALCRKIVTYHGGSIELDTGHTGGTRFIITLPAEDDDPPTALADPVAGTTGA
ncbi:sensor histidine kinase [Sphaerisporangium perillae]|uniref:sensor histidine kinase n=1 Tax=Sphaerisporangium perillae TaxID=2935860 RepID=UPI00200E02B6|nr:ATP-binding protein [Sphaerisporangium perillae]